MNIKLKPQKLMLIVLAVIIIFPSLRADTDKISQSLYDSIHMASIEKNKIRIWVYFKDKDNNYRFSVPRNKNQRRRYEKMGYNSFNEYDLDVNIKYLNTLREIGIHPIVISRWLNAASFLVNPQKVYEIEKMEFVKHIDVVNGYKRKNYRLSAEIPSETGNNSRKGKDSGIYGNSFDQLESINYPIANELGFSGKDIRISILDAGFNLDHETLRYCKILSAYDFISRDTNTSQQEEDAFGTTDHGTAVLSIMSGNLPGKMMGPAYNADFILARTEQIDAMNSVYEDLWIAAVEWSDSLGTEIILSSSGIMLEQIFNDFSLYAVKNLQRRPVFEVLKIAADRGILLISDAPANYSESAMWDIKKSGLDMLLVQSTEESWENIDLDKYPGWKVTDLGDNGGDVNGGLVLEGAGNELYVAESGGNNFYGWRKGSSYLAALTAAAAAVILEAHSDWNPAQVLETIRSSKENKEDEGDIFNSQRRFINIFDSINRTITLSSGDIDGNGRIDGNDLALFSKYYSSNLSDDAQKKKAADLDGNLIIDGNDLAILARRFLTN